MIEDIPASSTFLNVDNISMLGQVVNTAMLGEGKGLEEITGTVDSHCPESCQRIGRD